MMAPPTPHHTYRPVDPSLEGTLAVLVLFAVGVALVVAPLSTAALLLGAALGLRTIRYGLARLVRQGTGTTRAFSIPGVGRIEYRITPR